MITKIHFIHIRDVQSIENHFFRDFALHYAAYIN